MDGSILDSKWFYWIVTGVAGALWAGLLWFWKRQRDQDDQRFRALEKRAEDEHERVSRIISELPVNYTMRDEFLRVVAQQAAAMDRVNDKIDRIAETIGGIAADIAGLRGRDK